MTCLPRLRKIGSFIEEAAGVLKHRRRKEKRASSIRCRKPHPD